ncbi:hypothetical protein LJ756_09190 [Arthrobacter sp. zg-Y411]|uniref:hypothetical protein n=1 Tax=Arthrobacter zhangbolii TaxID=2886936 RepID=UPI001D15B2A6|nr:hypothetical protein [Arthrobacter zhangbolii]MCC3294797.1 hypothetical protein [Arthrobacter zhangbolii]
MTVEASGQDDQLLDPGGRFGDPLPAGVTLVLIEIDWQQGISRFVRSDGKEAVIPEKTLFRPDDPVISKSTYFIEANVLMVETRRGEVIGAELPQLGVQTPLGGRPVIYLDQKDWSALANTLYSPERVADGERNAASKLIDLARARKIILPLSSGHMAETTQWRNNDRRYSLALTIAQLSWGWQLQDPLTVRRSELKQALRGHLGEEHRIPDRDVFTLAPRAIHSSRLSAPKSSAGQVLPPELQLAADAMTSISIHMSVMLGEDPIPHMVADGWATKFQTITDWFAKESKNSREKRLVTDLQFIIDIRTEMAKAAAEVGMSVKQLEEWVMGHWQDEVAAMPSLGLYREILHEKQVNSGTVWKANDLTDLMYLSCAAGYADYVVGERSSISQMRQSNRRLGRPDNLYKNLSELVSSGVLDSL